MLYHEDQAEALENLVDDDDRRWMMSLSDQSIFNTLSSYMQAAGKAMNSLKSTLRIPISEELVGDSLFFQPKYIANKVIEPNESFTYKPMYELKSLSIPFDAAVVKPTVIITTKVD